MSPAGQTEADDTPAAPGADLAVDLAQSGPGKGQGAGLPGPRSAQQAGARQGGGGVAGPNRPGHAAGQNAGQNAGRSAIPGLAPGGEARGQAPRPAALPHSDMAVARPAREARVRVRHLGIMALAFLMIVLPGVASAVYLWKFAEDQYVSTAGFAIRTESAASPLDFLGAFGGGSTTTSKDMDILNNFVTSQQLVEKLDRELNLRAIYSKPANDPWFAFDTSGTIEDLVDYWSRMVVVDYDNTTGLMKLNVYAFAPDDARRVAAAVLAESSDMINKLASVARDDTTKYAKTALDQAEQRLQDARVALTAFRMQNNIVDPSLDLGSQSAVVQSLTQELVNSQIQLQVLKDGGAADSDPRVVNAQRRVDIIQAKINDEQSKVKAANGTDQKGYAELVSSYERLKIDQDFAEKAYLTALATYDAAVSEATHKQVYLATYEEPTLAQAATAPQRWLILAAIVLIGFFAWSIVTLVYYALRDRR